MSLLLLPLQAHAYCWQVAADRYQIDPLLLYAIARVESNFNPRAYNFNRDGSRDIGLMQVNSIHLPQLARFGILEAQLIEPCTSVIVGAWVLAAAVRRFGYTWQAVGAYNAGYAADRDSLRERYAMKVWRYYGQLCEQRRRQSNARAVPDGRAAQ
ncbi:MULTISPECIES: lytic transglycosylase domain-containing protein [Burkholderia]|uniref:lytic transglycosylase domain-containing protein n=1 Tax=Burkholderia TaxID=32008 RepID=UPI001FC804E7|nr:MULTISPECIES: lytic transglycosylase domain-containing protein [Burkholderia]